MGRHLNADGTLAEGWVWVGAVMPDGSLLTPKQLGYAVRCCDVGRDRISLEVDGWALWHEEEACEPHYMGGDIKFCPWCGTKLEVQESEV